MIFRGPFSGAELFIETETRMRGIMKQRPLKALTLSVAAAAVMAVGSVHAAEVQDVLKAGANKVDAAKKQQLEIDRIAEQTDDLLQSFKQVNKQIEGLKVYNAQLERQIVSQKRMMSELQESIENATLIERQIGPLMVRMLDSLENFIKLDLPFESADRLEAVARLRDNLDSAAFSAAEKFRQILELYDIESEYSRTIGAGTAIENIDGAELEVNVLRVGRIAYMYQSKDKSQTGVWNSQTGAWEELSSGDYRRAVDSALRIAQKLAPQDVLELPVKAPEAAQ